jgi:hypothetical protein
MEQDFNELTDKAISWSDVSESNTDNIALVDKIGLSSDCADWVFDPADGYIQIVDEVLPPGPIPLCVDDTWLAPYYVTVYVVGGYELILDSWYLSFIQKNELRGYADVYLIEEWKGDCCADVYYKLGFKVSADDPDGKICFDANNYPDVCDPFYYCPDPAFCEIPGKEIQVHFNSLWSGCIEKDQQFTISLVQRDLSNKSYVSPFRIGDTHWFLMFFTVLLVRYCFIPPNAKALVDHRGVFVEGTCSRIWAHGQRSSILFGAYR